MVDRLLCFVMIIINNGCLFKSKCISKDDSNIKVDVNPSKTETESLNENDNILHLTLLKSINSPQNDMTRYKTGSFFRHTFTEPKTQMCGPGTEITFGPMEVNESIIGSNIKFANQRTNSEMKKFSSVESTNPFQKLVLSGELFSNKEIIINHYGIENGLRKKKDGHCYIGLEDANDSMGKALNDLIVTIKDVDNTENENKRLFEIVYDKIESEYKINFLHKSLYLSIQITNENDYYFENFKYTTILLGKVTIFFYAKYQNEHGIINLKITEDEECSEFTFMEYSMPVTIGRCNCSVLLKHHSISKVHALVFYSKERKQFLLRDNFSTNKTSLVLHKGDWCFIEHHADCKIKDKKFSISLLS